MSLLSRTAGNLEHASDPLAAIEHVSETSSCCFNADIAKDAQDDMAGASEVPEVHMVEDEAGVALNQADRIEDSDEKIGFHEALQATPGQLAGAIHVIDATGAARPLPAEIADDWDLCEISSIASSWLPLECGRLEEQDCESADESGSILLAEDAGAASPASPKDPETWERPSYATILARSMDAAGLGEMPKPKQSVPMSQSRGVQKQGIRLEEVLELEAWEFSASMNFRRRKGHRSKG